MQYMPIIEGVARVLVRAGVPEYLTQQAENTDNQVDDVAFQALATLIRALAGTADRGGESES